MTGCTLAVVRGNGRDIVGLKTLLATWTPPSYFLSLKQPTSVKDYAFSH